MACTIASVTILSPSSTSSAYIFPKSSSSSTTSSCISKPYPQSPTSFTSLRKSHSRNSTSFIFRAFSHLAWVQTDRLSGGLGDLNPLISNATKSVSKSYVVLIRGQGIALRRYFMIDKEGVIRCSTINNLAIGCTVDKTVRAVQVKSSSTFPPLSRPRKTHNFPSLSTETTTTISIPPIPPKTPLKLLPENPNSEFQNKLVFLDSIGIDLISFLTTHPPIAATSIADIKSTVSFLYSVGLNSSDLRRAINMCPEIISSPVTTVVSALTFLLRDIGVEGRDLRQILRRRPRLLACSVENRLRPTQYFLQGTIGIADLRRHTHLLSCSVETKFIPRIDYFVEIGFSYRDTISMFRRFPALFCYSIEENLEPKFNYFVIKMGRDLKELKEFPQYFSFSLENRIKPRHRDCVEKGVCLSLPNMLRSNDKRFRERLEVYCSSTMPVKTSPLWCTKHDNNSL